MKTMKYIYTLFLDLSVLGLDSYMRETKADGEEQKADGLQLFLSVFANNAIFPFTRASATGINVISDLNIPVYSKNDNRLVRGLYLTSAALNDLIVSDSKENKAIGYDIAL